MRGKKVVEVEGGFQETVPRIGERRGNGQNLAAGGKGGAISQSVFILDPWCRKPS